MVTKGAKVLVIAAIDGTTLSDVLKQAKAKGITVIAYDRLIRDTPNVDYYATFDNFQVGVLQAQSIEQALGLKEGKGPFNIELFGGSPDDNNAYFFYNGAMSVLQPYIDSGKLVVASKQTGMDKVSTLRWEGDAARRAVLDHLQGYPRSRARDRGHGRCRAQRQGSSRQRHQDLQQRGQGGAVLSAQACRGRQEQLGEDAGRRRLLQALADPVGEPVRRARQAVPAGSNRVGETCRIESNGSNA
jgi:hypothetical protein